jgi:hypothetical protein
LPGSRSGLARPTDGARRRVDLHASEPGVLADQQLVEEPVRVDLQPAGDDLPAELLLGRGDGLRKADLGGGDRGDLPGLDLLLGLRSGGPDRPAEANPAGERDEPGEALLASWRP